jgi:hypothetical protein
VVQKTAERPGWPLGFELLSFCYNSIVNVAFLGLAEIEDAARIVAINENGGFGVGALPFCFGFPVLPFKRVSAQLPSNSRAG